MGARGGGGGHTLAPGRGRCPRGPPPPRSRHARERQREERGHRRQPEDVLPEAYDRARPCIPSGALHHHRDLEGRRYAALDGDDERAGGAKPQCRGESPKVQQPQGGQGQTNELRRADSAHGRPVAGRRHRPQGSTQSDQQHRVRRPRDVRCSLSQAGQRPAEEQRAQGRWAEGDDEPGHGRYRVAVQQRHPQHRAGGGPAALLRCGACGACGGRVLAVHLEEHDADRPEQQPPHRAVDRDVQRALRLQILEPRLGGDQGPEERQGHGRGVAKGAQHQHLTPVLPQERRGCTQTAA
mmetsp:Transcript_44818/g.143554  ORF Transcript_44818/g.143554 Transcript_44818/m.143554 type:complete len:296 (+) Transcript_44818:89-976(+)